VAWGVAYGVNGVPEAPRIGLPVLKRRIARVAKQMAKAHGVEGCAPALTFRLR